MDIIIYSFSGISILLLIGKYLRAKVKFFQNIFLPSSVIAGLLGLIIIQLLLKFNGGENLDSVIKIWSGAPGFLINIVFATLFMGKAIPGISKIWDRAGVQVVYGQIVGWGHYLPEQGQDRGFVLTVIPEPSMVSLMILGCVLVRRKNDRKHTRLFNLSEINNPRI